VSRKQEYSITVIGS